MPKAVNKIYIYMYECWSKFLYPEMDIFAKKNCFRNLSPTQLFSFAKPVLQLSVVSVDSATCKVRCDQTGTSSTRMRSNWDVKHTAVIKLECQAQGCDQTRLSIRTRSIWDVKHQDVAKQKRTRNWNPSCRRRYLNYCIILILSNRDYPRCQQSNYLWTTGFPT